MIRYKAETGQCAWSAGKARADEANISYEEKLMKRWKSWKSAGISFLAVQDANNNWRIIDDSDNMYGTFMTVPCAGDVGPGRKFGPVGRVRSVNLSVYLMS